MSRQKTIFDQLTPNQRLALVAVLLLVIGIVALVQWWQERRARQPPQQQPGQPGQTLANRNVRFGMPAPAKADPASKDAYLIERPQYVLSYSDAKRTANWVCWNLNAGDIGKTKRAPAFLPDPGLPRGFQAVKSSDYDRSGFDRGHMCPSADRSDSEENNRATFYTTNIVPQSPQCNQHGWERFERHCRDLTRDGSELYVAAGPFGEGGTGRDGERAAVGKPQVVVPAAVWKVVMVLPNAEALPTQDTRALAVWMPNDMTVSDDWKRYAVPVAEVERRTGFKFFPLVPDDVAGPIKSRAGRGE
jgi:endonuclease G